MGVHGRCGLFALAAEYLYHFASGQVFVAANKRTAYLSAVTFLDVNGIVVERSPALLRDATLAIARKEMGKQGAERALRRAAGYHVDTAD